ncbi:hypothetical protein L249_5742 [Ophiocordyceps polyrhachis-furcata BCC 54312]|uniref:Uncharacterized protein n=1 Tax=Ophiocordyceps polyrhachis-furcata BCC 54312 TaxID=1330021 RepID=A0A367L027_9HYPO|nr:hypothetical protein L249_5742 [Ophiocordyceps polyrhachis-furcata BCC 54312]
MKEGKRPRIGRIAYAVSSPIISPSASNMAATVVLEVAKLYDGHTMYKGWSRLDIDSSVHIHISQHSSSPEPVSAQSSFRMRTPTLAIAILASLTTAAPLTGPIRSVRSAGWGGYVFDSRISGTTEAERLRRERERREWEAVQEMLVIKARTEAYNHRKAKEQVSCKRGSWAPRRPSNCIYYRGTEQTTDSASDGILKVLTVVQYVNYNKHRQ